jgi:PilZ domain-containing protein
LTLAVAGPNLIDPGAMLDRNAEKRRSPRIPSDARGRVKSSVSVKVLDISTVGVQFELSAALRPGSTYELSLELEGHPLAVAVRITRCRAGGYVPDGKGGRLLLYRAGAEFLHFEGNSAKLFQEWVQRRTPDSHATAAGELLEPFS